MNKVKFRTIIALTAVIATTFLCGCAKNPAASGKEIIAYVNKDPIYADDLKRDIALRAKLDPTFNLTSETEEDQLDAMIDRKIIVQYAMEKGLAREERFVNTIRTIWEHTLIRDFVDYKKKELADYLFATDEDVKKYYDRMSEKVTFKVLKSKDARSIEKAYKKYLADKDTSAWQAAGPIGYDEISSIVLLDAFDMPAGEAKKFEDEPNHYLVEVVSRDRVELAPIEALKPEIERRVVAMKERRLFEDWLKERKKLSKIKVNTQYLKQESAS